MKFCYENIKDIGKYFNGSFVKFVGLRGKHSDGRDVEANECIHTIDKVSGNTIYGKRWDGDEIVPYTFTLYSEETHPDRCPNIEMILPKKSYFNTIDGAYYLSRIPARQYSRGITSENTAIQMLIDEHYNKSITGPLLQAYVRKPMFMGFGERDTSYAVSSRVAVSTDGGVFVDTTKIGGVDYPNKKIHVLPIFHEELKTILSNHGQTESWSLTNPEVPAKKVKVYKKGDVKPKQEEEQF